jgi:hypothetical protein
MYDIVIELEPTTCDISYYIGGYVFGIVDREQNNHPEYYAEREMSNERLKYYKDNIRRVVTSYSKFHTESSFCYSNISDKYFYWLDEDSYSHILKIEDELEIYNNINHDFNKKVYDSCIVHFKNKIEDELLKNIKRRVYDSISIFKDSDRVKIKEVYTINYTPNKEILSW